MLINNEYGTLVILEDKIFHIEDGITFDTGPISEEDKKEIELTDWYIAFKKNGRFHRDNDLPAIIYVNGSKYWYQNNLLHRDNDLPAIIWMSGEKEWHQNGNFIRREHANQ